MSKNQFSELSRKNRLQAIEEGLKFYTSDTTCKKCGTKEKYVSNSSCVQCAKQRILNRDKEIHKKYITSEKGREWLKQYRKTDSYRDIQNRWCRKTGFSREQQARRRRQMREQYELLNEEEKMLIKEIYAKAARLSIDTGIMHHVDHIEPLFKGGKHHPSNLQILEDTLHWNKCRIENKERKEVSE
jgi:hypothetical protein